MSLDILRFRAALVRNGSDPSGAFGARPREFVVLPVRREASPQQAVQAD